MYFVYREPRYSRNTRNRDYEGEGTARTGEEQEVEAAAAGHNGP